MKITIHNLHINIFAGKVSRSTYNYFAKKSKISLTQYIPIGYWGDIDEIPLKHQFYRDGNLVKNCLLWRHQGIILNGATEIVVTQENKEIFQTYLMDWQNQFHKEIKFKAKTIRLEDSKIKINEAVFMSSLLEVSLGYREGKRFFVGEINTKDNFSPKKLKIFYKEVLGTRIIEKVTYDGIKIKPNKLNSSTYDEFQKAWWYLPNGEIPYDFHTRFAYEKFSKVEWFQNQLEEAEKVQ